MKRFAGMSVATLLWLVAVPVLAEGFVVTSQSVRDGERLSKAQVFNQYGCDGDNLSPDLAWQGAPRGTKSFAITVFDPDAPTGAGWWHWIVYDLPEHQKHVPEGAGSYEGERLPKSAHQALNDFQLRGYSGACPPVGDGPHRYIFTVHALKVEILDVPMNMGPTGIGAIIRRNSLAQASLIAGYQRK